MTTPIPFLRQPKTWVAASGAYLVYAATCWIVSNLLGLSGGNAWILRIALWLIGAVAGAIVLWFIAGRAPQGDAAAAAVTGELDAPLRAADARLKQAGARNGVRGMPLLVVVGPEGGTKTSVVVNSGLEPELLAGEVYHGGGIGPTPTVNIWYSQKTLLLEMGGTLAKNPSMWSRLVRRIRPRTLHATLTGRPQSPRAALVCFSCEQFLQPGSGEAIPAAARELRTLLLTLAQGFGVELPVYVLFTKADRIPHFPEYVQHLTREESQQVLGTTLRWPPRTSVGLYADREFQRLNTALDRLIGALAGKRPELLAREQDEGRRGSLYEFPRELRKLVPAAVQFLVDLCRPTQLSGNPVLRGIYFTGVRAVEVSDAVPSAAPKPVSGSARVAATQAFDRAFLEGVAQSPVPSSSARKLPQWLFLGGLFRDVLLTDHAPKTVARSARQVGTLRRASLAAAIALALVLGLGSTVAFVRNRGAIDAANALETLADGDGGPPSEETLSRLETLRSHLDRLSRWSRWGLYKGTSLYPALRQAYAERFDRILLRPTRNALMRSLDSLPARPTVSDQYGRAYSFLKTYLMTTSNPEHLAAGFVVPVLMDRFQNGRELEPARQELARLQFEFYADELCRGQRCGGNAEGTIVTRTRAFLNSFTGADAIYELMVADAGGGQRAPGFHREYPSAAAAVTARYEVPAAFTPQGWTAMQQRLKRVEEFFQADQWVLGQTPRQTFDAVKLEGELRRRYVADYRRHWRAFLANATLGSFGTMTEASQRLADLSSARSPLLQLFAFVSRNTNVDSQTVGVAFRPVRSVVPPTSPDGVATEANKGYRTALGAMRNALQQAVGAPNGPGMVEKVMSAADGARAAAQDLTSTFGDDTASVATSLRVTALLEEPILRVERLMQRLPANELNTAAADFCRSISPVLSKFPFRSTGPDATLNELRDTFDPKNGAVVRFYGGKLQNYLDKQGTLYLPKTGVPVTISQAYARFFTRLAGVSDLLWPGGSAEPRLSFTIKLNPPTGVDSVFFTMDGSQRRYTQTIRNAQPYQWQGSSREVGVSAMTRGREDAAVKHSGLWGLFHMLQNARWLRTGEAPTVLFTLPGRVPPLSVEADLNLGAAWSLLKGDYFQGYACLDRVSP